MYAQLLARSCSGAANAPQAFNWLMVFSWSQRSLAANTIDLFRCLDTAMSEREPDQSLAIHDEESFPPPRQSLAVDLDPESRGSRCFEGSAVVVEGPLEDAIARVDGPSRRRQRVLELAFLGESAGREELQVDGEEAVAAAYFPPERLPQPLCGGGHDQAIAAWRARMQDRWQPGTPMRYCPHCAHPLEERLAFERLRKVCPVCGFVYFRALKVGISLLVEDRDRILLVRRAVEPGKGKWGLPSGFVEWDESPDAAARAGRTQARRRHGQADRVRP